MKQAGAWQRLSMRSRLLLGILPAVILVIAINTVSLYRQALESANTAYDRTLLASAKSIGETLEVVMTGAEPQLRALVSYSALEAFEADNRSQIFYKVSGFRGEFVSGYEDFPAWTGRLPDRGIYAALVDFYDERFRGDAVRVAVLLQPVAGRGGQGVATIQVAETLELRHTLARQILIETLWHQALLVGVIAAVVAFVVQRATRPIRRLSEQIESRGVFDLQPLVAPDAPRELMPLVEATNHVMRRLEQLLAHQKRFVRDASHQLRTPLAVLKTQVQSALRGDVGSTLALEEISVTVQRATELANQMLALAKVEQLRQQGGAPVLDWSEVTRAVALDLAALIAERRLDFSLNTGSAPVRSHEWALRELTRNLLHNAIKNTRDATPLSVSLDCSAREACLTISDCGPGIDAEQRERLFQPFAAGDSLHGSGLGLAICAEIVQSLEGRIDLDNRQRDGRVVGLDARVHLPLSKDLHEK